MIMVSCKQRTTYTCEPGYDDDGNGSHAIISSDPDYLVVLGYWVCCHSFIVKIEADDCYLSIFLLAELVKSPKYFSEMLSINPHTHGVSILLHIKQLLF